MIGVALASGTAHAQFIPHVALGFVPATDRNAARCGRARTRTRCDTGFTIVGARGRAMAARTAVLILLGAFSLAACASSVAPGVIDAAAADTAQRETGSDAADAVAVPDAATLRPTVRCGAIECPPTEFCVIREVMSVRQPPVCVARGTPTDLATDRVAVYCDEHADCAPGELCKEFLGELARIACGPANTPCFRGERRLCNSVADCPTCDQVLNPPQACNALGVYPASVCVY